MRCVVLCNLSHETSEWPTRTFSYRSARLNARITLLSPDSQILRILTNRRSLGDDFIDLERAPQKRSQVEKAACFAIMIARLGRVQLAIDHSVDRSISQPTPPSYATRDNVSPPPRPHP